MSFDVSTGDHSDDGSTTGVCFSNFIDSFLRLVARHGWSIRFFNVDDLQCSHWVTQNRGIDLSVAKCKVCLRHKLPSNGQLPRLCSSCMFPFHPDCADARGPRAPTLCGACDDNCWLERTL